MKESVAIAKEANSKKESSPTRGDNSALSLRNEPERQLGSLRDVIGNIRRNGGTPSVDSIATELSSMHTAQRAPALLALQRTHGNRYVQRVVTGIQAKLKVGQPGDKYEQEADRVAEQVMQMPEPQVQQQPEEEEEEELQAKELPGQTSEVTPNLESRINAIRGDGQPLSETTRAFFEPRFGYDFSQVRVHTDVKADTLNRVLNARAFTTGLDIFFRQGVYNTSSSSGRGLLAHELTHVTQQMQRQIEGNKEEETVRSKRPTNQTLERVMGSRWTDSPMLQLDLVRQPPGREGEYTPLTEEKVQEAITYNTAHYQTRSIRWIQDIIGAPVTDTADADTIHMICEWQADFGLTVDGKIGRYTLQPIVQEMIAEGQRNNAILLIIDGHNMSTNGLVRISYDPTFVAANAITSGPIPGNSTVRIGPSGFSQGYPGLVHTIAHELEHVRQRRIGMANRDVREFLAEAIEILSEGMLLESIGGMMDDALRALYHWNCMPVADQVTNWNRFQELRNEVRRRFNAASAATQATHQDTMNNYNAVAAPAGAGP